MQTEVVLFYSTRCGYCVKFMTPNGTWDKIKQALGPPGTRVTEVDVNGIYSDTELRGEYMNIFNAHAKRDNGTDGVPQVAIITITQGVKSIKWHIGCTDDPNDILNMLPDELKMLLGAYRGSAAPKSRRKSTTRGRLTRSATRSTRSATRSKKFTLDQLIEHVLEHCKHIGCKKDVIKALECAKACGCYM